MPSSEPFSDWFSALPSAQHSAFFKEGDNKPPQHRLKFLAVWFMNLSAHDKAAATAIVERLAPAEMQALVDSWQIRLEGLLATVVQEGIAAQHKMAEKMEQMQVVGEYTLAMHGEELVVVAPVLMSTVPANIPRVPMSR